MKSQRRTRVNPRAAAFAAAFVAAWFAASDARAALQPVQSFGNNPSNISMFVYVPAKLASHPPILVALHYCTGSASAYYTGEGAGFASLADQYGYVVIYPQTTAYGSCWDVFSQASLTHNGGSDSAGIVSMVKYAVSKYGGDSERVYAVGTSSGAMMTNVLLGSYPDVFKAGAAYAGVPFGCFAGTSSWNEACAMGQTIKTPQEWGDLVRAAYPGYTGYRPRMQLWHGDQDMTLNFANFGEEIKQWTNVLGVSQTATTTEQNTPQPNYTRTRYDDACGIVRVEAVREIGAPHLQTVDAPETIRFFGLDRNGPDPGMVACGDAGTDASANTEPDAAAAVEAGAAVGDDAGTTSGSGAGTTSSSGTPEDGGIGGAVDAEGSSGSAAASSGSEATSSGSGSNVASGTAATGGAASSGNADATNASPSGCSCHAAGRDGGRFSFLLTGPALLVLWRRRRRTA